MPLDCIDRVHVVLPRRALEVVFDECDRHERDETGGRVVGFYRECGEELVIEVVGIIGPGPRARRSPVSFFQDGRHQERIFRRIECEHPEIEHLGNWHTHHVNGTPSLSRGDIETYRRIVNHAKHNTHFFYALLVVARLSSDSAQERYDFRHYFLERGDSRIFEIDSRNVEIRDAPLVWPKSGVSSDDSENLDPFDLPPLPQRALDREVLHERYPELRPYTSKRLGFYWRGPLTLQDGSRIELLVLEDASADPPCCSVVLRDPPETLRETAEILAMQEFTTSCDAVVETERACDRALASRSSSDA